MGSDYFGAASNKPQALDGGIHIRYEILDHRLKLADALLVPLNADCVETQGLGQAVVVGDQIAPAAACA